MPPRKKRIPIVFDTNVILGFYLSPHKRSANAKVFRLWRNKRQLQLIVSDEVVAEYLEILSRLGVEAKQIQHLRERIEKRETVTHIGLGARPQVSRDPDDDVLLATALAGNAKYLVTNDYDLLDISTTDRKRFKFTILTPKQLLDLLEE